MIITIDGPSASGKSSTARALAEQLQFFYISSGLLFRGLAYCLLHECGYDEKKMKSLQIADLEQCITDTSVISYASGTYGERLFLRNVDVTAHLKSPAIDQYSSIIGTNAIVREAVNTMQRMLAEGKSVVAEGRDCGSVVFPEASFKFFLTASVTVRAHRWQADQAKKGFNFSEQEAIEHIQTRDIRDSQRAIAPLIIPRDAIVIDTSDLSKEQTVVTILNIINAVSKK